MIKLAAEVLVANSIIDLLESRQTTQSICPSEVARRVALAPVHWRSIMPLVRAVAVKLAAEHRIEITQRHSILDPKALPPGPIRLRRGPKF